MNSEQQIVEWTSCPVCGGATRTTWVEFDELAFGQCSGCGTVYKTRERSDALPTGFYEQGYHDGKRSRRWEHRVSKAMSQIRAATQHRAASSVLDVGCSVGYVVEAGRRLGLRSAGVDVSQWAVDTAKAKGLDARVGSIEELPCQDGEFDLVVLRHVLEHTPRPRAALQEVRRVLAPHGLVLVLVPDVQYWKGQYQRETYRYFRPDDLGRQHFVYYDDSTLEMLLTGSGFRVLASLKGQAAAAVGGWRRAVSAPVEGWARLARAIRWRRELFFVAGKLD